jgi:hypothetical protein
VYNGGTEFDIRKHSDTLRVSPLRRAAQVQTLDLDGGIDIPEFSTVSNLSLYVSNVAAYMAGYVGRNLLKKIDCHACNSLIMATTVDDRTSFRSDCVLLDTKNNGGLFIPSADLVSACKIIEAIIREIKTIGIHAMSKKTIQYRSVSQIVQSCLFKENGTIPHNFVGAALDNTHVIDLIKMISSEYSKIRLHFIAREETLALSPTSVRQQLAKTIIFKGQ